MLQAFRNRPAPSEAWFSPQQIVRQMVWQRTRLVHQVSDGQRLFFDRALVKALLAEEPTLRLRVSVRLDYVVSCRGTEQVSPKLVLDRGLKCHAPVTKSVAHCNRWSYCRSLIAFQIEYSTVID